AVGVVGLHALARHLRRGPDQAGGARAAVSGAALSTVAKQRAEEPEGGKRRSRRPPASLSRWSVEADCSVFSLGLPPSGCGKKSGRGGKEHRVRPRTHDGFDTHRRGRAHGTRTCAHFLGGHCSGHCPGPESYERRNAGTRHSGEFTERRVATQNVVETVFTVYRSRGVRISGGSPRESVKQLIA